MNKKVLIPTLILIIIISIYAVSVISQTDDENALPDNPEDWSADDVKNNPDDAFSENPDKAVELYPDILNDVSKANTYFSNNPDKIAQYTDKFENAISSDSTLLRDTNAMQSYFDSKGISVTVEGPLSSYDDSTGTFTTGDGQRFTKTGIENLAGRGYSFKVDANGVLQITGPDQKTYSFIGDGSINDNGQIDSGTLRPSDGSGDIVIVNGPVTPNADGSFTIGSGGKINIDKGNDGVIDLGLTSNSGDVNFVSGGDCPATGSNCVSLNNNIIGINGDGALNIEVDLNKDSHFDGLNMNVQETDNLLLQEGAFTGNDFTTEPDSVWSIPPIDIEQSLKLNSVDTDNVVIVFNNEPPAYTLDSEGDITVCSTCEGGDAAAPEATHFFSFVGKAWDWMTGRFSVSSCIATVKGWIFGAPKVELNGDLIGSCLDANANRLAICNTLGVPSKINSLIFSVGKDNQYYMQDASGAWKLYVPPEGYTVVKYSDGSYGIALTSDTGHPVLDLGKPDLTNPKTVDIASGTTGNVATTSGTGGGAVAKQACLKSCFGGQNCILGEPSLPSHPCYKHLGNADDMQKCQVDEGKKTPACQTCISGC